MIEFPRRMTAFGGAPDVAAVFSGPETHWTVGTG